MVKIVVRSYDLSCYPRVHISVLLIDDLKKRKGGDRTFRATLAGLAST